MLKMTTLRLNACTKTLWKVVDYGRQLIFCDLFPGATKSIFKAFDIMVPSSGEFLLKNRPYQVVHRTEIWRIRRPNVFVPHLGEKFATEFHRCSGWMCRSPVLLECPSATTKMLMCPGCEGIPKNHLLVHFSINLHISVNEHQRRLGRDHRGSTDDHNQQLSKASLCMH